MDGTKEHTLPLRRNVQDLSETDYGPPYGFAQLGDPYGANEPGYYRRYRFDRERGSYFRRSEICAGLALARSHAVRLGWRPQE